MQSLRHVAIGLRRSRDPRSRHERVTKQCAECEGVAAEAFDECKIPGTRLPAFDLPQQVRVHKHA